jgi:glucose-6-phosphate 1-epimerase
MSGTTPQPGIGGLPKLTLVAADGACAEIYLHGAHVTSWVPAGSKECFFLSRKANFRGGEAIRGGVPVVFPQFAEMGVLPKHGFARTSLWDLVRVKDDSALFRLTDSEVTRSLWPHAFVAEYTVRVGGRQLTMTLDITNSGAEPFTFTAALHTYFSVLDVGQASVAGLTGIKFLDSANGEVELVDDQPCVRFPGEVDRVYLNSPRTVHLVDGERKLAITSVGFADIVVWNPGQQKCAALPDLEEDDYMKFVCVEAAAVDPAITLNPGSRWQGSQILET